MDEHNFSTLFRKLARRVHNQHIELGADGKGDCGINRFGDRRLRADEVAEQTILDTMGSCGIPVRGVTEEMGVFTHQGARYTLFADGLDGSSVYKRTPLSCVQEGYGRYATMFAIYAGIDPLYRDALVSCIVEHPTRRLIIASEAGCYVEHFDDETLVKIARTSGAPLSPDSLIYCESEDPNWGGLLRQKVVDPLAHVGYTTTPTGCTAWQYVDVAIGKAAATVQWSRKDNIELAVARQIVEYAGGRVITLDGRRVADLAYDTFGHDPDDVQIIIAAANTEVAYKLQRLLSAHR